MIYKLLFFTDVHATDRKPSSRKDDYYSSILDKLCQIDRLSRQLKVDMIVCGGDVTHVANESYRVFNDLFDYFKNTYKKHVVIAGQTHDFVGEYNSGMQKSVLGSLKKAEVIDEVGQTWRLNLGSLKIYSSHETICPNPFFGHHTLYKDFNEDANIVLISHMHMPFGIQTVNNRIFVSPGSIARNSSDSYNIDRIPQVVLLTVKDQGNVDIQLIPLEVKTDIFDSKYMIHKEEEKNKLEVSSIDKFDDLLVASEVLDIDSIITTIGEKYDSKVVETALEFKRKVSNG